MQAIAEAEAIADPRKRSEWVFPSENRAKAMDARNFYIRTYVPAVEAARLKGLTWHALRHTFASRLAMSGKGESTIAALLRHSTTTLVKRYAHLSPSHLRAAVEGLTDFGKEQPSKDVSKAVPSEPVSSPTVSGTGTATSSQQEEVAQGVDNVGAGEGI